MNTAELTCPHCGHKQGIEILQNGCLAFYKCEKCGEIISVPKESENCCVVCEYSDKTCPISNKRKDDSPKCTCCR